MRLTGPEYLSETNPLATVTQRDIESQALDIVRSDVMVKARERATGRLSLLCKGQVPDEVASRLELTMQEWAFHYVLLALNSDSNHPRVVHNHFEPEHAWFGMEVPGNRTFAAQNWDNTYTIIPIDPYSRFELRGRRMDNPVADTSFSITGNVANALTLDSVALHELHVEPDGTFALTVGPEAAAAVGGRRSNHLQTKLTACYLLIRDTRSDWLEVPNAYAIERLSEPLGPRRSVEELIEFAALQVVEDVSPNYWFRVTPTVAPVNVLPEPIDTGTIGGLVSQSIIQAQLEIADDEAFVMTVPTGRAKAYVATLYDFWQCWMDWRSMTSLNKAQSAPNADGTLTYVVAHEDPGVHNWLDTSGVHQPRLMQRWHVTSAAEGPVWVRGELVKLKDLDAALPAGCPRVTPAERQVQLAERARSFPTRYVDS